MILVREFKWCDRCRIVTDWTVMRGYIVCNICGKQHDARRRFRPVLIGGLVVLTGCFVYLLNK